MFLKTNLSALKLSILLISSFFFFSSNAQSNVSSDMLIDLGKINKKNEDVVDLAITNTTDESIFLLNYQRDYPLSFLASQPFIPAGETAVYRIKVNPRKEGKFEERLQLYFSHSESPFIFNLTGDVLEVPVNDLQKCPSFKDLPSKRELVRNQKRAEGNIQEFAYNLGKEDGLQSIVSNEQEQVNSIAETSIPIAPALPQEPSRPDRPVKPTSPLAKDSLLSDEYLPNNIIFLIDASSSMEEEGRFYLLKMSLIELLKPLRPIDYLSMISYAGESKLLMEPTSSIEKDAIEKQILALEAGGSTNAVKGIDLALETAYKSFIEGGNNEIYLVTDGEFYLGSKNLRSRSAIKKAAAKGIHISALAVKSEKDSRKSLKEIVDLGEGKLIRLERIADKDVILKAVKESSLK